jgi:hypothetical protein
MGLFFIIRNNAMPENDNEEKPQTIAQRLISNLQPAEAKVESADEEIQIDDSGVIDKTDDSKYEDSLVTEELAEALHLSKSLIGKPLKEAGKSIKETYSWANENNKKLIQLETKLSNIEGQLSTKQVKEAETAANLETKNQLGKMPDPLEKPEEFAEWLEKRDEIKEQKMLKVFEEKTKGIVKSFDDNPKLKQAEEIAAQNTWNQINESIQTNLPKDMKADDVLNAFFENNPEEDLYIKVGDQKISIYDGKPRKFVADVLTWLKSQSYDSLKNQKDSDVIKKIQKKTKENLEKISSRTVLKTNVTTRKEGDEKPESIGRRLADKLQASQRLKVG